MGRPADAAKVLEATLATTRSLGDMYLVIKTENTNSNKQHNKQLSSNKFLYDDE